MDAVTATIEQDTLTPAFDRLAESASAILDGIAKTTAEGLQAGVRGRLQRQLHGTGKTADAVTIERVEGGYRVTSGTQAPRPANLPIWLEFGTRHMHPRPAWEAERLLWASTYWRRCEEGLQHAIDGLGGA